MSKLLDFKHGYKKDDLIEAAKIINDGGLVLFPTETVYGIGADGLNEVAVKNIFIAKGRAQDNPLILHVSSIDMIKQLVKDINDIEEKLINNFFPGPLTIIFEKKDIVPDIITGGLNTVAIRMPENEIAHDLIKLSNTPIAAPSANISGRPSGTNIKDIFEELNDKVDLIIDGGDTKIGVESTVIRVINGKIHILRPGKITVNDLNTIAPVIVDNHVLNDIKENQEILSPGMKYKHYAPNTKCILLSGDDDKVINKINEYYNDSVLVIAKDSIAKIYKNNIPLGNTLDDISHNIFKSLRCADKMNKDLIIIVGVEPTGLGLAIMNRLIRACSHNYIKC